MGWGVVLAVCQACRDGESLGDTRPWVTRFSLSFAFVSWYPVRGSAEAYVEVGTAVERSVIISYMVVGLGTIDPRNPAMHGGVVFSTPKVRLV